VKEGLVVFDVVFHLSSSTVDRIIDKRRPIAFEAGCNKTDILSLLRDFYFAYDSSGLVPCACLVEKGGEQSNLFLSDFIQ